jgi:antitoxin MazE
MRGRVQKWGNSLALRIPKAIAIEAGFYPDSAVDVRLDEGKVVIEAVTIPLFTLEEMLAGITDENIHAEIDTGPAMGNEAW